MTEPFSLPIVAASVSGKINFGQAFAGQAVGIKEVDGIWLVRFMDYDLGYIDLEGTLQPLNNPFGPKVQTMSPERSVNDVSGLYTQCSGRELLVHVGSPHSKH